VTVTIPRPEGVFEEISFVATSALLLQEPNLREVVMLTRKLAKQRVELFNRKRKPARNPIDHVLRHEVFKRDGYRCVECGAAKAETSLHVDHRIPVSRGGADELDNLQTLCRNCNLAKSNKIYCDVSEANET
jgi:hypothetical protein